MHARLTMVMMMLFSMTGCAAVFKGSKAEVHFEAIPEGSTCGSTASSSGRHQPWPR